MTIRSVGLPDTRSKRYDPLGARQHRTAVVVCSEQHALQLDAAHLPRLQIRNDDDLATD